MLSTFVLNRGKTLLMASIALATLGNVAQAAEIKLPETTLTASLRTSMVSTNYETSPDAMDFSLNSLSFYVNGKITDNVKFSFSSEINSSEAMTVQDAIAQFEFSPTMNIWMGRFLAPTDRANSYGAYFSNNWNFATDGTQDGYPFITFGRADGVAYWGDFADTKLKISAGLFDVPSTKVDMSTGVNTNDNADKIMTAARVQYDFWDAEPGYYINGTYLGEKDILAVGVAMNSVDGNSTTNVDFLMEKKVAGGGAFTIEGEYIKYDKLGGYDGNFASGDGYYLLGSYLFPQTVGIGKIQLLAKFGTATFEDGIVPGKDSYLDISTGVPVVIPAVAAVSAADYEQDTAEFNVNYIIKSFNAKMSLFVKDTTFSDSAPANKEDNTQIGIGVQLMTL